MNYPSSSQGEEWRNLKPTEFPFHRTWDTSKSSFIPKAKCLTRWNASKTLPVRILTALLIVLHFPKADGNYFSTAARRVDLLSQKAVSNHTKDRRFLAAFWIKSIHQCQIFLFCQINIFWQEKKKFADSESPWPALLMIPADSGILLSPFQSHIICQCLCASGIFFSPTPRKL